MRIYKLIGALAVVLAFGTIALAATASAEEILWKWLPGSVGETLKGAAIGSSTLQFEKNKSAIPCGKASILLTDEGLKASSELLKEGSTEGKDATLWLLVMHFSECKALGLSANSVGDSSGIILVHAEIHNCMISVAKKEFGLLVLFLQVHIEIPSTKLLLLILEKGLFITKIESEKESKTNYLITAAQQEGKQGIEKCEGGTRETLLVKVDESAEENAGLAAIFLIEFDRTIDKEGQTMMEK
jgi:hypothetical protein